MPCEGWLKFFDLTWFDLTHTPIPAHPPIHSLTRTHDFNPTPPHPQTYDLQPRTASSWPWESQIKSRLPIYDFRLSTYDLQPRKASSWPCESQVLTWLTIYSLEQLAADLEKVKSGQVLTWLDLTWLELRFTANDLQPRTASSWPWESYRTRPRWRGSWGGGCRRAGRWASSWPRWDARSCGCGWPSPPWSACCRTGPGSSLCAARGTAGAASRSRCPQPRGSPASPVCRHGRDQRLKSSYMRLTSPVSGHGRDQRLNSTDMRLTSPVSGHGRDQRLCWAWERSISGLGMGEISVWCLQTWD